MVTLFFRYIRDMSYELKIGKNRINLIMKLIYTLTFSLLFFSTQIIAEQSSFLVKYFDCASSTNFISNNLPVFTKIQGKKIVNSYKAGAYTSGIDISVATSLEGNIEKINLGPKITLTPAEFKSGIEFGVANLTAHTIQLINFNELDGGTLEFGFLKKFSAKRIPNAEDSVLLGQKYRNLYGDNWGLYRLRLTKDSESKTWKVIDENANKISAIFGIMAIKNGLFVFGISDMTTTNDQFDISGKIITISKGDKSFECEI